MDHSLHGQDRGLVRWIPIEGIDIVRSRYGTLL
jgi:hypothetical protein